MSIFVLEQVFTHRENCQVTFSLNCRQLKERVSKSVVFKNRVCCSWVVLVGDTQSNDSQLNDAYDSCLN